MPAKLPDSIKSLVIQQWLQGKPRNYIASENGLSSGAVTNIVNEWRRDLGLPMADELRELTVTLKKVGITASQCALGFRMSTIMLNIGVNEEDLESFILDVYNRCKDIGLSPASISYYIEDLLGFSTANVIPLSKIKAYLNEKRDEKRKLEQEIERLNAQISTLKQEEKNFQSVRDRALREKEMTIDTLNWYFNLKQELAKYSIPIDDISEFARLVNNIRQHSGYDADKVLNEFWDLEMLRTDRYKLHNDIASLENSVKNLKAERSALEADINIHNQTISTYDQLNSRGLGLKQLHFLLDTVKEIAAENGIDAREAVSKFLSDVEEQYDKKLGFEQKIQNMREEINKLGKEQVKLRTEILSNPLLGPKLLKLIQSGLSEQDIINVADIIEKFAPLANAVIGSNPDIQSLVSDLNKYGDIKSATQGLTTNLDTLRKEAAYLVSQNKDLEQDNLKIFSSSIHISSTVDFLRGAVFSLRNELMNLVLMYMFITMHLLKPQFHEIEKLQSPHQFNEFAALSRSKRGEKDVPIKEIKKDVREAVEVLLNRIGPTNDTLAADLLVAYNALME